MNNRPKHLVVFSGVAHYSLPDGTFVAHGGFVREIDNWARIFDQVTVAAVQTNQPPKADDVAYQQKNVVFSPVASALVRTDGILGKLKYLVRFPTLFLKANRLIDSDTTAVMARGPDSIGALGILLGIIRQKKRFAKYAGQWGPYSGETSAYRLQRAVYRVGFFGGPVIVNAAPDARRPHIVSLLNSSITRRQWEDAAGFRKRQREDVTFVRFLYVGRISPAKGVDVLLRAFKRLESESTTPIYLDIMGDGELAESMQDLAASLGVRGVSFHGWKSREELLHYYANADCFVSCSRHQGLDKVLLEAMTLQLPIIATNVSVVPHLINAPECGLIVKPDDIDALVSAMRWMIEHPSQRLEMGNASYEKSGTLLLDDMEARYRDLLREHLELDC